MFNLSDNQQPNRASLTNYYVVVLVVSLLTIAVVSLLGPRQFAVQDTQHYLQIAFDSPNAAPPPWAYRILVPTIVKILPFSSDVGFFVITYGATLLILLTTFGLLRELGISYWSAIMAVVLLGTFHPIAYYLGSWGMVDPLANLFVVLALYLLLRQKHLWAIGAVSLGVLAKETTILILPLILVDALRARTKKNIGLLAKIISFSFVPLGILLLLRLAISPTPGQWDIRSVNDAAQQLGHIWEHNTKDVGILGRIPREFLRTYGFFWMLAFFGLRLQTQWRTECLYLIVVGFALCGIATDWFRMLGWSFAGILIPTAIFIDKVRQLNDSILNNRILFLVLIVLAFIQSWLSLIAYRKLESHWQGPYLFTVVLVFSLGTVFSISVYRSTARGNRI